MTNELQADLSLHGSTLHHVLICHLEGYRVSLCLRDHTLSSPLRTKLTWAPVSARKIGSLPALLIPWPVRCNWRVLLGVSNCVESFQLC